MSEGTTKKARGFGAMPKDHVKAIARKGGQAAHAAGTAHQFNSAEARTAGVKGGKATHAKRKMAAATTNGATDPKDPNRDVQVACSSASGCSGIAKAKDAGGDYIGEIDPKAATKSPKGPSADEDPENMGSCGSSGGCGSHD